MISEVELAAKVQEAMGTESNIAVFSDNNGRCVLSGRRFEQEYGVHAFGNLEKNIKDMTAYMQRHKNVFLNEDELKLPWWKVLIEKWRWLIKVLFPFFENMVCFIPFFMMNNRTVGSEYFANLDPFLLYVLLFCHCVRTAAGYFFCNTGGCRIYVPADVYAKRICRYLWITIPMCGLPSCLSWDLL